MIHFICALKCEAKPLIAHYQLKHLSKTGSFSIYRDKDHNFSLTLTGPGKLSAAAGTGYTHGLLNTQKSDGWLNIGVAGHKTMEIGKAVLAHRIQDSGSGNVWYPQLVFEAPCLTAELKTLDKPSTSYTELIFDMEATGFYATASRFASSELIHSLKIISDNAEHPTEKLEEKHVEALITEQMPIIDLLVTEIRTLSTELETIQQSPPYYEECLERWRFTQYERHTLFRLLNRWNVLCPEQNPLDQITLNQTTTLNKGKNLILALEDLLDNVPIEFSK